MREKTLAEQEQRRRFMLDLRDDMGQLARRRDKEVEIEEFLERETRTILQEVAPGFAQQRLSLNNITQVKTQLVRGEKARLRETGRLFRERFFAPRSEKFRLKKDLEIQNKIDKDVLQNNYHVREILTQALAATQETLELSSLQLASSLRLPQRALFARLCQRGLIHLGYLEHSARIPPEQHEELLEGLRAQRFCLLATLREDLPQLRQKNARVLRRLLHALGLGPETEGELVRVSES